MASSAGGGGASRTCPMRPSDLKYHGLIGRGSYGKVLVCSIRDDKSKLYAVKILNKANVVQRKQVDHTRTERNVLEVLCHPFIVKIHHAFQTRSRLYVVLEYCPGGELFFHLTRAERFGHTRCKFYSCEILLAIHYLHSLNIIYRDLKPENVLLDREGHVRVTDFGLSKEGVLEGSLAHSMCGTPEYLAPEILAKKGHGKAVDWYSLGALMYEMLTGLPPYYSRERKVLFEQIRSAELRMPNDLSAEARDLLARLLERDPQKRLGSERNDGMAIMSHKFFQGVDWRAVLQIKEDENLRRVMKLPEKKTNSRLTGESSTTQDHHSSGFSTTTQLS
ncbi:unnamed protein product [Amoebophrya sp. A25]|nr:unnamed protein product [Amoebophrya sp. A25]|eukprot:GSA25T00020007001.1